MCPPPKSKHTGQLQVWVRLDTERAIPWHQCLFGGGLLAPCFEGMLGL